MKILQFLVSLTLISIPFYLLRCKNFSWCASPVPFTLLEILILITFASWVIWKVYLVKNQEKKLLGLYESLRGPIFWPLAAFLFFATISVFISPDLRAAAGIWKAYFIEPAMLFVVISDLSIRKKSLAWVITPLILSGFWVATIAIWQGLNKTHPFALSTLRAERVTSIYTTPNAIGLYLGSLFFVALGSLIDLIKSKKLNWQGICVAAFFAISLIFFALAIYLSGSRGAILALILASLFYGCIVIYTRVRDRIKKFVRFAFMLGMAVFLLFSVFYFINIDNAVSKSSRNVKNSAVSRLCIWQATKNMVVEKTISGVGLSGFQEIYPRYATCETFSYLYPHNIFLNFWSEIGLFGLLAFLWVVYSYLKAISGFLKSFLAIGLFSLMIYVFAHGFVDVPYFKNDLSTEMWVFFAMVAWFYNKASEI